MKRAIALLCAAFALVSCSKAGAGWGTPGVVHVAFTDSVPSLVPEFAFAQNQIDLGQLYTQSLVGIGNDNRPTPLLCTQVPSLANGGISPDGRTITYHLRRDVRFADGVPFTSADVAFTYRAILDPRNPTLDAEQYRRITSLETPDPWTVRIRLKQPWPAAVDDLFAASVFMDGILPAHAFHGNTLLAESAWAQRPFGTGPFRVAQWIRGEHIVFVPNPYAKPKPRLRKLIVDFIADSNAAFVAVQNHSEDIVQLDSSQVEQARMLAGVKVMREELNSVQYLEFNVQSPRVRSVAVRRAIAQAIDRSSILRDAFHGLSPAATTELAPVLPEYDASIGPPAYDPAYAKAYFAAHPLGTIDLAYQNSDADNRALATMLQAELQDAGIKSNLHAYPIAVFYDRNGPLFQGHFDLAFEDLIGGLDAEDTEFYRCVDVAPSGVDTGRFCDRAYDAAHARAAATTDAAVRAAAFVTMQRAIAASTSIIPLSVYTRYYAVNRSLTGFHPNMLYVFSNAAQWEMRPE